MSNPKSLVHLRSLLNVTIPANTTDSSLVVNFASLAEFITWAVTEHPHYRFHVLATPYGVRRVAVEHNGNVLGEILEEWHGRNYAIALANDRIYKDMERGKTKRTKEVATAKRLFKKYFGAKTDQELSREAIDLRLAFKQGVDRETNSQKLDLLNSFALKFLDFALREVDAFVRGLTDEELRKFLAARHDFESAEEEQRLAQHLIKNGYLIRKVEDGHLISDAPGSEILVRKSLEEMSADVQGNYALLAFSQGDEEVFMQGVGYRKGDVFIVLDGEGE